MNKPVCDFTEQPTQAESLCVDTEGVFAALPERLIGRADWLTKSGRIKDAELMYAASAEIRESRRCLTAPVDAQLLNFYGVTTAAALIAAQARHIERLQAKLPQTPSLAPVRAREG